ncbi:MAG: hypothetical protein ACTHK9_00150 [Nitrobacter sp.]
MNSFVLAHDDTLRLWDIGKFLALLDTYRIDATLLDPSSPAVHLLDRLAGWRRIYGDRDAVVHIRTTDLASRSGRRWIETGSGRELQRGAIDSGAPGYSTSALMVSC